MDQVKVFNLAHDDFYDRRTKLQFNPVSVPTEDGLGLRFIGQVVCDRDVAAEFYAGKPSHFVIKELGEADLKMDAPDAPMDDDAFAAAARGEVETPTAEITDTTEEVVPVVAPKAVKKTTKRKAVKSKRAKGRK